MKKSSLGPYIVQVFFHLNLVSARGEREERAVYCDLTKKTFS